MIYHCDVCNEDRYIPGECTDPICPTCRVSRSRDNVRAFAERRIAELSPKVRKQFGEGAPYSELALTPEGRELIGWEAVLRFADPTPTRVTFVGAPGSLNSLPREISKFIQRVQTFRIGTRRCGWVELLSDHVSIMVPQTIIRAAFETCDEAVP